MRGPVSRTVHRLLPPPAGWADARLIRDLLEQIELMRLIAFAYRSAEENGRLKRNPARGAAYLVLHSGAGRRITRYLATVASSSRTSA